MGGHQPRAGVPCINGVNERDCSDSVGCFLQSGSCKSLVGSVPPTVLLPPVADFLPEAVNEIALVIKDLVAFLFPDDTLETVPVFDLQVGDLLLHYQFI